MLPLKVKEGFNRDKARKEWIEVREEGYIKYIKLFEDRVAVIQAGRDSIELIKELMDVIPSIREEMRNLEKV